MNLEEQNGICNPHRRVIEDLKIRNANNGQIIAGEYFKNTFTYDQTFKMFDDYKKALLHLEGYNNNSVIISAPSTIASVNSFYGAIDADKIATPIGPGFLYAFTKQFTQDFNAQTVIIYDGFLNETLIQKLHEANIKNVIITSITDYMHPYVKDLAIKSGTISGKDFLDEYIKSHKNLPSDMQFLRLKEFAEIGAKIPNTVNLPYKEKQIGAIFLTGATTSIIPKAVKIYADGLNKMAQIYDKTWFDFNPGDRNTVFIPIFYATGAIHGVHAGLFSGMTNIYQPKYDRFAFPKDLLETKAKIALVAPSHIATFSDCKLEDNSLAHTKYIFIGGEAVTPSQMKKYREDAKRLGVQYVLDGYGMTETASMTSVSDKTSTEEDVSLTPVPGVKYRIVDPITKEVLPDNVRGILEKYSPCALAGYTDEEKNKNIFTADGWINTGDIAIRYPNGKYRVFGRSTDYYQNQNQTYMLFDIEEEVLKHPGIAEAEAIKFKINEDEYPAIVVVVKEQWQNRLKDILAYISSINIPGIKNVLGTRFIKQFNTNEITAKRDYLSLPYYKDGYYSYNPETQLVTQIDLDEFNNINSYLINDSDIIIRENEPIMIRTLK